jgi:hypothetical protein
MDTDGSGALSFTELCQELKKLVRYTSTLDILKARYDLLWEQVQDSGYPDSCHGVQDFTPSIHLTQADFSSFTMVSFSSECC